MGPSQICGCPFREPRVFEIAHMWAKRVQIYNAEEASFNCGTLRSSAWFEGAGFLSELKLRRASRIGSAEGDANLHEVSACLSAQF